MKPALRVMIIEDSPDDALLMLREVEHAGYTAQAQRVQTAEELRDALAHGTWDVVLADHSLPHFSAPDALAILRESGLDVPFIVVSGSIGEEMAVRLMRDGAADYVMKDHMTRLGPVVERELHEADERKRKRDVEQALAESEKRYRTFIDATTDLAFLKDERYRYIVSNKANNMFLGKSESEVIGHTDFDLIPHDAASICRTSDERVLAEGKEVVVEETVGPRTYQTLKFPVPLSNGRVGVGAYIRDITERKRAEEDVQTLLKKLQEEKDRLSLVLANIPDEVWFADATRHFTLQNPAACKAFALENPGSIDIQSFAERLEVLRPDGSPRPVDEAPPLHALAGETIVGQEEIIRLPSSGELRYRQVNSSPVRDAQGNVIGCVSVVRDITDRKKMEEKLQQSEADLQQAQALAHTGSWRWDIARDELTWSDEMYRIYGITPQDPVPSWHDVIARIVHPDDRARVEAANRVVLAEHKSLPIEYRIVWPDGSVRTVWDQTGKITLDRHGNVASLTGVVMDITERKQAETEREALQAQLHQSQKLEAIGQLAGGVAHDFNNLLTGILGNVAIMRSDMPAFDPLVANLVAVETAARQAADLAKGLLTFGRRSVIAAEPLDMGEAVDTSLRMLKQSLPATMEIIPDVEPGIWSVRADHSQIAQVMLNLAVNARDAMEGTGTLTISLRNEIVGEEYVQNHPFARTGEFVHLSVADTGPGIPDGIREHLFEPFYTTKEHGTGLGLSIVYGAVKQANGWITADSPAGGGTVFDIFLPRCLERPAAPAAAATGTTGTTGSTGGTVLVVDDEEVVRTVTAAMVKRSGYTALTAENGAAALRTLQEHQGSVDLVLLDMTMPGMTTREIIPALRAISPTIAIVLASGFTSSDEIQRMLDNGTVQGFLGKPYPMSELMDMLGRTLKKK